MDQRLGLHIGVTPAGYDDIGAVLRQAGYSFTPVKLDDLRDFKHLQPFHVIFINCSIGCTGDRSAEATALRQYVSNGGALYVSDYAADYLAAAFPEYLTFGGRSGAAKTVTANVTDLGLQVILGPTVQLTFDMGGWVSIEQSLKAQVHLEVNKQPILASFDFGQGHVVYTSFHNKKALAAQAEAELLRYLILKPLTARAASTAKSGVVLDLSQEYISTLSKGNSSPWHEYSVVGGEPLLFALSWQGNADCRLAVQSPDGSIQDSAGNVSPIIIFVPFATSGSWKAQISISETDQVNLPAHLIIGPPTPDQIERNMVVETAPLDITVLSVQELPIMVLSSGQDSELPIEIAGTPISDQDDELIIEIISKPDDN